jgi:predicted amidohydrolase YtcJ
VTGRFLIRDAEVEGARLDVLVEDGVIVALGADLADPATTELLDAAGGALLPGLHDHHVHLLAMAARMGAIDLDGCETPSAFDLAIGEACAATADWVRAGGYDEHRHGPLDRARLDALAGEAALRVQHRTGLAWVLSSTALLRVDADTSSESCVERDADGHPTGWVHRGDAWLGERIGVTAPDFAPVGRELAALGLTGITDATAELGAGRLELLHQARISGAIPQHLLLLGAPAEIDVTGWAAHGPAKLLADEMLGLDPIALAERIRAQHRTGRAVAIHAVSRVETVAAVTALREAGMMRGDRLEHGSVLPMELDDALAEGGVTVIIQPALVGERGDHHLATVDHDDLPLLHRQSSLLAAGVILAAGSDAPVTSVDPWRAIATATDRRSRSGVEVGAAERVDARTALDWFLTPLDDPGGAPRRLTVGAPADLCLLAVPLAEMLAAPSAAHVRSAWIDGVMVHP